MPTSLAAHEMLLLLASATAVIAAAVKVIALCKRRGDHRGWLRLLSIADFAYLAVVFAAWGIRYIPSELTGITLIIPGVIIEMILNASHGFLDLLW